MNMLGDLLAWATTSRPVHQFTMDLFSVKQRIKINTEAEKVYVLKDKKTAWPVLPELWQIICRWKCGMTQQLQVENTDQKPNYSSPGPLKISFHQQNIWKMQVKRKCRMCNNVRRWVVPVLEPSRKDASGTCRSYWDKTQLKKCNQWYHHTYVLYHWSWPFLLYGLARDILISYFWLEFLSFGWEPLVLLRMAPHEHLRPTVAIITLGLQ